ncbi:hypothetical protein [Clostridium perfringens]|uniref:hypothetical protein n=1 Tax=Clostridium perfringens TaxID=1502 RepID=UPI002341ACC7|nr:hypothetical protein [Clostridium perfringens]MDC4245603.1 hypothetical protein [Clostridium perfringens]
MVIDRDVFYNNPEGYLFKLGSGKLAVALRSLLNTDTYPLYGKKYGFNIVTENSLKDGSDTRIEDDNMITGSVTDWNYRTLTLYEKDQYSKKDFNDLKIIAYKNCGDVNTAIISMLKHEAIEWDYEVK